MKKPRTLAHVFEYAVFAVLTLQCGMAWSADPAPKSVISDPNPYFSGVWVDTIHNELVVTDENKHRIMVYRRTASGAAAPLRVIGGPHVHMFNPSSVVVDPKSGEIWAVNDGGIDFAVVFPRTASGDVSPSRQIGFDDVVDESRSWGWAVDDIHDEVAGAFEQGSAVHIFDRVTGALLRSIKGPHTDLGDPHGIFIDTANDEIFVTNHGFKPQQRKEPSSILVYRRTAAGDVVPIRKIQGPHTLLDEPRGIHVDVEHDEIAVANDNGTVTIFRRNADGDVRPKRIIGGPRWSHSAEESDDSEGSRDSADRTGLNRPTGVFIDTVNNEIFVTNWANHTITVYRRTASGNAKPIRTITTSIAGPTIGALHTGALSLDQINNEYAMTNCVTHPGILIFARGAKGQTPPLRVIAGEATEYSRGAHGVYIDNVNNEILAPSQFAEAIVVYNRTDSGNIPPKRMIVGPHTGFNKPQGIFVDTVHNEILVPNEKARTITVHDRLADGDAAPLRVITSAEILKPKDVWIDHVHDEIFVADEGKEAAGKPPRILVFTRLASGPSTPIRMISGELTMMEEPRQMNVDPINDEIYMADEGSEDASEAGTLFVFDRLANGNVPPKRFIRNGGNSNVKAPRGLYFDPVRKEIVSGDDLTNEIETFNSNF